MSGTWVNEEEAQKLRALMQLVNKMREYVYGDVDGECLDTMDQIIEDASEVIEAL